MHKIQSAGTGRDNLAERRRPGGYSAEAFEERLFCNLRIAYSNQSVCIEVYS
jgi:hypothetical protein